MLLPLLISQSAVATPFCGVELNFTSVDFSENGSQGSSVDTPKKMAQLKSEDGAFGAKKVPMQSWAFGLHRSHQVRPKQSYPAFWSPEKLEVRQCERRAGRPLTLASKHSKD
jgi:hypothetical protein